MEPGIYPAIPEAKYHGGAEVSVSTLKEIAKPGGPARVRGAPPKDTKSLRFGSLIHAAIVQPHEFDRMYHVVDLARLNTNDGAYKQAQEKACGREIVRRPDFDEACRIRDAVMAHPTAREILCGPVETEQSVYWTDEVTGLPCRGRVDIMRRDMRVLADLKSCEDASPLGFPRTMAEYGYDWQDAFYRDGVSGVPGGFVPDAFLFIPVEKSAPYLTAVFEIDPVDIRDARSDVRKALDLFNDCLRADEWPGYSEKIETVSLPERKAPWRQLWRYTQ